MPVHGLALEHSTLAVSMSSTLTPPALAVPAVLQHPFGTRSTLAVLTWPIRAQGFA